MSIRISSPDKSTVNYFYWRLGCNQCSRKILHCLGLSATPASAESMQFVQRPDIPARWEKCSPLSFEYCSFSTTNCFILSEPWKCKSLARFWWLYWLDDNLHKLSRVPLVWLHSSVLWSTWYLYGAANLSSTEAKVGQPNRATNAQPFRGKFLMLAEPWNFLPWASPIDGARTERINERTRGIL